MMAVYRLTETDDVVRVSDGAVIPYYSANADRNEYEDWIAAGGTPDPVAPIDLPAYAAKARYEKEIAGTLVAGIPIATDDRSKQMLLGARVAADADPEFSTQWVGADGSVYPLTGSQVIGISNAVLMHVAGCFSIYANVKAAIDAGTVTTTAEIDAAFA